MPSTQQSDPAAVAYARSLLELAREHQQQHERIGQDLSALREAVEAEPAVRQFLANPAISDEEKLGVLRRALGEQPSPLLNNFMGVLAQHGRLGILADVAQAYDDLLDELLGKVEVDVTVAQRLGADDLERVRQQVSRSLGKDAVVHQYVDESIVGGLILRVGDKLLDASVKKQLEDLRQRMLAATPGK